LARFARTPIPAFPRRRGKEPGAASEEAFRPQAWAVQLPPPLAGGEDGPFARHCRADHPNARRAAPGRTGRGGGPASRDLNRQRKSADEARKAAVEALKPVRYFHRQALWLQERFPDAQLRDVPGLVKLVSRAEIEANDWSLTPGRYVGVAPEEVDEDFDFEAALRDIHVELKGLNEEAVELAARIARNFEELGA